EIKRALQVVLVVKLLLVRNDIDLFAVFYYAVRNDEGFSLEKVVTICGPGEIEDNPTDINQKYRYWDYLPSAKAPG
ncbi:4037_t:CDS:1, partial [Acaulospora colombiana]